MTKIPEPAPCYLPTDQSEGGPQSGILGPSPNPVSKTLSWKSSGGSGLLSLSLPFSSVDVLQVTPDFVANTAVRVWLSVHQAHEPSLGNKSSSSESHSETTAYPVGGFLTAPPGAPGCGSPCSELLGAGAGLTP